MKKSLLSKKMLSEVLAHGKIVYSSFDDCGYIGTVITWNGKSEFKFWIEYKGTFEFINSFEIVANSYEEAEKAAKIWLTAPIVSVETKSVEHDVIVEEIVSPSLCMF